MGQSLMRTEVIGGHGLCAGHPPGRSLLERAGVPRSVAMKLTGQKTESIYRRHAIVAESDSATQARSCRRSTARKRAIMRDKVTAGRAFCYVAGAFGEMAGSTGLEPATSGLTVPAASLTFSVSCDIEGTRSQ